VKCFKDCPFCNYIKTNFRAFSNLRIQISSAWGGNGAKAGNPLKLTVYCIFGSLTVLLTVAPTVLLTVVSVALTVLLTVLSVALTVLLAVVSVALTVLSTPCRECSCHLQSKNMKY
jgi:hypothetical protein